MIFVLYKLTKNKKFRKTVLIDMKNKTLQGIFGADKAPISLFFVPTYPTGMWCFQYGIKGDLHPKKITNQTEIESLFFIALEINDG
jgi:spermidine synthase